MRETPRSRLGGSGHATHIVSICQIHIGKILTLRFKLVDGVDGLTRYFFYISIHLA